MISGRQIYILSVRRMPDHALRRLTALFRPTTQVHHVVREHSAQAVSGLRSTACHLTVWIAAYYTKVSVCRSLAINPFNITRLCSLGKILLNQDTAQTAYSGLFEPVASGLEETSQILQLACATLTRLMVCSLH